jgi:hypothetical protein
MSQQAALRALDAEIHAGLTSAGFAESGTYTPPSPPGGAAFSVRVMREDVQVDSYGDNRSVASTRTELVLLKADFTVAARRGGTVLVDGSTFTLEDLVEEDQSLTRWVVR